MEKMKDPEHLIIKIRDDILFNMDCNPYSATYGCLDRDYWHYRMVREFPSSVFQAAVLPLAIIAKITDDKKILHYVRAGFDFWRKIQNGNGSFSEWYRGENSYVATAFTLCAILEAIEAAGYELGYKKYYKAFSAAARFLRDYEEKFVQNHTAGAAAALYKLYELTGTGEYEAGCLALLQKMGRRGSSEGWFYEYGGFDYGYHSVTLYYLDKVRHESAYELLRRGATFLKQVLPPDHTVPFSLGSRSTAYLFASPFAGPSLIKEGIAVPPPDVFMADTRYRFFFFYNDLLFYIMRSGLSSGETAGPADNADHTFLESGLVVRRRGNYQMIVNYKKNGNYVVVRNGKTESIDNGIIAEKNGQFYYSSFVNPAATFQEDGDTILIRGMLLPIPKNTFERRMLVPFKVFNATLGKMSMAANITDHLMKRLLVQKKRALGLAFERRIRLTSQGISCIDSVEGTPTILPSPPVSFGYSPTSNLFYPFPRVS